MSTYKILPYSYDQAKKLKVQIKPSSNPKKKIDVFKDNKKIATIGAQGYMDYPHYLQTDKALAKVKRNSYKMRHYKDLNSGNGFYANKILWT